MNSGTYRIPPTSFLTDLPDCHQHPGPGGQRQLPSVSLVSRAQPAACGRIPTPPLPSWWDPASYLPPWGLKFLICKVKTAFTVNECTVGGLGKQLAPRRCSICACLCQVPLPVCQHLPAQLYAHLKAWCAYGGKASQHKLGLAPIPSPQTLGPGTTPHFHQLTWFRGGSSIGVEGIHPSLKPKVMGSGGSQLGAPCGFYATPILLRTPRRWCWEGTPFGCRADPHHALPAPSLSPHL